MSKESKKPSMFGGLLCLSLVVAFMAVPMAIGYYTMKPGATTTQHAEAAQ